MITVKVRLDSAFGELSRTYVDGLDIKLDEPTKVRCVLEKIGFLEGCYGFVTKDNIVLRPDHEIEDDENLMVFPIGEGSDSH